METRRMPRKDYLPPTFPHRKYITYKEWKPVYCTCNCIYFAYSVSTLPIRNGNSLDTSELPYWRLSRKYLTYKEWKQIAIIKLLIIANFT